ncbi:MAG TPA: tripartite tricarboxylate transporter permease [Pseudolabrys sp.]|nr:tripartite tricarboxylate transporter permease [Pseudolabrys sp.]
MLHTVVASIEMLMRLDTLLMMSFGLVVGILIGALPGFTTTMAMAVLLPISFFLSPVVGIPFLIGVYKGGIYGGSIPAVLVGIPGTGASVATTYDGLPLTRKGQSRKALEMALVASAIGDFSASLATVFLIGPIALVAMKFGPPELAAVMVLSMLVIAFSGTTMVVKSLVMLLFGMFFAMIGQDPIGALSRFTFGFFPLESGINLLPMLIGLFAIPEVLLAIEDKTKPFVEKTVRPEGDKLTLKDLNECKRTIARSTVMGAIIGMIPGVGQVVAALMAYASAKAASPRPELFGTGIIEGVAAPEAANNAVNGPTMVPLLTLGIPGDNITAILLGAFVVQGLRPGPQLFAQQATLIYAILFSMLICCVLLYVLGYLLIPLFSKVVMIRKAYLVPLTIVFAFVGTYVYRSNVMDLYFLIFFGLFGYAARKLSFDVTPLVMAFILTPVLEYSLGQSILLAQGNLLHYVTVERPLAFGIILATPVLVWLMWYRTRKLREPAR